MAINGTYRPTIIDRLPDFRPRVSDRAAFSREDAFPQIYRKRAAIDRVLPGKVRSNFLRRLGERSSPARACRARPSHSCFSPVSHRVRRNVAIRDTARTIKADGEGSRIWSTRGNLKYRGMRAKIGSSILLMQIMRFLCIASTKLPFRVMGIDWN